MKQYNIYENHEGLKEAVKQGWSWPGFFFSWIWCFTKKINGYGAGILVAAIFLNIITASSEEMSIFVLIIGLGISSWMGYSGNKLRGENLVRRGFMNNSTVTAATPEGAIAIYVKEKKNN